ncbi:MAG TPA: class I SAM-dependent methyltransferase [Bacillales bacterium]|nr:class I SAM-dependent methyltransferase [Bacillales bacterium]
MAGHRFSPEKADKLLSDDRKKHLPAEEILKKMELHKQDVAADLGAGNGYFTIPIAQYTENTVYAVDIEPKMIEMLKSRAAAEQIHNIQDVTSGLEEIPIGDHTVDKVLISFVLHEVPNIQNTLDEIKRILKPDGMLFLIEWKAVEMDDGPPLHERIPSETLGEILQKHGFTTEVLELNAANYAVKAKLA